ncbi:MAG TPA: DUF378 domain-containing protein [Candidatus Saccharibacteria bacterium]|nr:DUF378 domain-containing protein [Candidatus Saccharibacteria bacterium]HRN90175.1 DUF378 domain-containing protein [Candidatus Saccharibacteria bacterium]HRN97294.1 DUF378 domain-containing protein [Candidatus Saccharibacteria bacterium]HRQ06646.1 DUF378 domain-containing protein [Candidatus Saccharibacteria bacterium]HRQ98161.1 DUF378 domain-containing protein [Candidatus Saccharibacteria bacterium]
MKALNVTSLVLVIIGGLNWGLVGAFDYNLVDNIFGMDSALARVVYVLVGLAAVYLLVDRLGRLAKAKEA